MNYESKLSQVFETGLLEIPDKINEEYLEIISSREILVLENMRKLNDYTISKESIKRNFSSVSGNMKVQENNGKLPKVQNNKYKPKVPLYEFKKYENKSKTELIEERDNYKKMLEDLKNIKDPKTESLIEYYNSKKEKWIKFSQESVYEILKMFPQTLNYEKNTIKNILERFKVDKELIKYDEESDDFI